MWDWVRKATSKGRQSPAPSAAAPISTSAPAKTEPEPVMEALARRAGLFHTTRSFPIYYCGITKCGSTFLKNLFYALDHGVEHPDGDDVHGSETGLLRAGPDDVQAMVRSPYVFAVIRDPVGRFVSVYFDKIYGTGPRNFEKLRTRLAGEIGLDLSEGIDLEGHRENCRRFANWIEQNLNQETKEPVNYHWKLQTSRLRRLRGFPVQYLTLDGLDWQLPELMRCVIPDLSERMSAVSVRNVSTKPEACADLITPELREQLERVYAPDMRLYSRAVARWAPYAPARLSGGTLPAQILRRGWVRGWSGPDGVAATGSVALAVNTAGQSLVDIDLARLAEDGRTLSVLVENPVSRMLNAYVTHGIEGGSDMMWRYRRAGGQPARTESPLAVHQAAFHAFLSYTARQLRLGGPVVAAWCRPQAASLIRSVRAPVVRLAVAEPKTHPSSALPDGIVTEALEAQIAAMYPADLELYRAALSGDLPLKDTRTQWDDANPDAP